MIPIDSQSQDVPPLSSDFAERVVRQANFVIARRRRRRRQVSASVLGILTTFGVWSLTPGRPIVAQLDPLDLHAGINTEMTSRSNEEEQAGLKSFFFPDADAVARLADQDSFGDQNSLGNEYAELDADGTSAYTALVSVEEVESSR